MRTALILLSLTLATTSFALTGAKYTSLNMASAAEIRVYHLLPAFTRTNTAWGSANNDTSTKFDNAPAGYWAFFAQGSHGRDQSQAGRPGSFMGIYYKAQPGYFTVGTKTGGSRGATNGGSGGLCSYVFDDMARPGSNPTNTAGWVVVAGGGGGRGNNSDTRGGDAGGQTGRQTDAFRVINGRLIDAIGVEGAPDYPSWAEVGFLGGFQANQSDQNSGQQHTTDANTPRGGGGAGVTGGRAKGGTKGSTNASDGGWFSGGTGSNPNPGNYHSGGGGNGVWGGGGGGSGTSSGGGGGGSSYTGAIMAVPEKFTNPTTYYTFGICIVTAPLGHQRMATAMPLVWAMGMSFWFGLGRLVRDLRHLLGSGGRLCRWLAMVDSLALFRDQEASSSNLDTPTMRKALCVKG